MMTKFVAATAAVIFAAGIAACEDQAPTSDADKAGQDAGIVSAQMTDVKAADGRFISWKEHLIDDDALGGTAIRGTDGLSLNDFDGDGIQDVVYVNEDSDHIRISFGATDADKWTRITLAAGALARKAEDVSSGDVNGDGHPDIVVAAERGHVAYFQNPGGASARNVEWPIVVVPGTTGRGSWIRVFVLDIDKDGKLEVVAVNKNVMDPPTVTVAESELSPISIFEISGDALKEESWKEYPITQYHVPVNAEPIDIDQDDDMDIVAYSRAQKEMFILENIGNDASGHAKFKEHKIKFAFADPKDAGRRGMLQGSHVAFHDIDGDGRQDITLTVVEKGKDTLSYTIGWLQHPETLDENWIYHPFGDMLPDTATSLTYADIDGDGDADLFSGSYSGIDLKTGGYSGDPREYDGENVTVNSAVGRLTWFANPGREGGAWIRHDMSRTVRGMYDMFVARDMDGDGDMDFIGTRGNSGKFDGPFWIEQVRTSKPQRVYVPARKDESKGLPLPPQD